ncbi:MAG: phosphoribosylglycinamide formyltransferase [Syntrophomonadaceae bacterium]|jgi:phosphoribosylglycinamide formyltransferase-1|nr:phosphoribosylglycinamide formyltransferase [Syntrophomonadaceae bacterium]
MKQLMTARQLKLAVLASGRGSNFDAIGQAIERKDLNARIVVLISDQSQAPALAKAAGRGIETLPISPRDYSGRDAYEECLVRELEARQVDLVVLAGYMRLVGKVFLQAYEHRVLNIHPALLPSFPGLHAQQQALDYGVKISGCTVHLVDEGMDSGPIILQKAVAVLDSDDEEALSQRILKEEHQIYWQALQLIAEGRVWIDGRRVVIKDN